MKNLFHPTLHSIIAILLLTCFTSCASWTDWLEGSFDGSKKASNGDSYDVKVSDAADVGLNISLLMATRGVGSSLKKTSFLLSPEGNEQSYLAIHHDATSIDGQRKQYPSWMMAQKVSSGSFADNISVLTGLEFVQKNSKDEETKLRLAYLEVPILGLYNYDLNGESSVFGGLGPYLAYGIGGKIKGPGYSIDAFDKDAGFKRFDAGLTFTAGYKINKKLWVRLGFDLGLADIDDIDVDHTHNRSFSLNVGYSPGLMRKLTK